MNFDDLKERLRETLQGITSQIQESSAWNQLVDKYQDLSPNGQKLALVGSATVLAFILLLLPMMFYFSSQDYLFEFEDRKQLMRELFRVTRAKNSIPPGPPQMSPGELMSSVQGVISTAGLQPDQSKGTLPLENPKSKTNIGKSLEQSGVAVQFAKLNLSQLVDLGKRFEQMRPNVKMIGIEVKATQADPHFFDVTYKLVAFTLPPEKTSPGGNGRNNGRGNSRGNNSGANRDSSGI